eukprot:CAMPEP_0201561378 /NCGR_PEP_ID=MMETSP0173_2-20130828/78766_1 /ASSEMBLY_ACC=CAM_ASM_000268 /TAXON_ID=218659 /ORGANISM="Vexillifera sp., Strain DIVA3 564/2" /LENGTH=695 /DNA_ID=CAMNT_0047975879 /DNA_START=44 /DNA_END=2129 /DNA_ORIENTATION=-
MSAASSSKKTTNAASSDVSDRSTIEISDLQQLKNFFEAKGNDHETVNKLYILKEVLKEDVDLRGLVEVLPKCQQLTYLDVEKNELGLEGAKALAEVLPKCQQLARFDLKESLIGDEGAKALSEALPKCQQLTHFTLKDNEIYDEGIKALVENCQQITHLELEFQMGDEECKALAEALPKFQQLTHLNLPSNEFEDEGIKALAEALPNCQQLTHLNLNRNCIGDTNGGVKLLAEALPNCQQLTHLNLSDNDIDDEGAKALAKALPNCQQLTHLDLNRNDIGDEGCKALAEALPNCKQLTHLELNRNYIGDEGAKALVKALPNCQKLIFLTLKQNKFGGEVSKVLEKALSNCQQKNKKQNQKNKQLLKSTIIWHLYYIILAKFSFKKKPMSSTKTDSISKIVENHKQPLCLFFHASWSETSGSMKDVFSQLSERFTQVRAIIVDADDNASESSALASKFNVSSVPTFLFFSADSNLPSDRLEGVDAISLTKLFQKYAQQAGTNTAPKEIKKPTDEKALLNKRLHALINYAPIMLFGKGVLPDAPKCKFSRATVELLNNYPDVTYSAFNILGDPVVRQGLKEYSNWPTYPQLYVNGKLIGGLDILKELHEEGELGDLLRNASPVKKQPLNERLKQLIEQAPIMLFGKGELPHSPQCKFSRATVELLKKYPDVEYSTFNILADQEVRQGLKEYSNWPTY